MIEVFVVTNPENGWDCVVRVFTTNKAAINFCGNGKFTYIEGKENLEQYNIDYNEKQYCIHKKQLID